MGEKIYV